MSRNMVDANKIIFQTLDNFAQSRGVSIDNAGLPRWIASDPLDRKLLKNAALNYQLKISPFRSIARFDYNQDNFFVLFGFDLAVQSIWLGPVSIPDGLLTAALSELLPRPIATPLEIKQIVDAQDNRDVDYSGHAAADVAILFPPMTSFIGSNLSQDENERIIYDLFLSEAQLSNNWIEESLVTQLRQLAFFKLVGIPYASIARASLDYDPSALFMSLYRCMEALYAHSGANKIRSTLNISTSWSDVAVALEQELNWRPVEWQSLESLVSMGYRGDIAKITNAIKPAFPGSQAENEYKSASDLLYKLRNSVVHYRQIHKNVDHNLVDWNTLCASCVDLIAYMYSEIFNTL